MYAVVVNEGPAMADDNATYFTREEPTFRAVFAPIQGTEESVKIVFAIFTPTNGHLKGKEHKIPWERVVAVVEDDDTDLHSVKA